MPGPNFNRYREIVAKHGGRATACGRSTDRGGPHWIEIGDVIGYYHRPHEPWTVCASCWAKWVRENAQATATEGGLF